MAFSTPDGTVIWLIILQLGGGQGSYEDPKATFNIRGWLGSQICICRLLSSSLNARQPTNKTLKTRHIKNYDVVLDTKPRGTSGAGKLFCNQHDIPINPPVSRKKESGETFSTGTLAKHFPTRMKSVIHNNGESCQPWQLNINNLLNLKVTLFHPWQLALGSCLIINNKKDMQSL